ncbi:helix-turn-helix domain-containing protein [bacterium]|nr:helix-turn-helix domain-containing protein [bacterium]
MWIYRSIIDCATKGDESAFNQLVHKYQTLVYKTILRYVKNRADAEDMTQETLIRAFQNLHQLKEPEKFRGIPDYKSGVRRAHTGKISL